MTDISPPSDLSPKKKFFEDVGEDMLNADACIQMVMTINTPEAKAIRRHFRRRFALYRERSDLTPEKQRENAFFDALEDAGHTIKMIGTLPGTMD